MLDQNHTHNASQVASGVLSASYALAAFWAICARLNPARVPRVAVIQGYRSKVPVRWV
jgi:hypothetical protein